MRVASRAASVSLSTRIARASGNRRTRSTSAASPSTSPHCGPPRSLSPEAVTRAAPARSVDGRVGLVRQPRMGASRPEPMSATTGTPSPARSATDTDDVKPSTRKLEGCTLSTNAVSGPTARS